MFVLVDVLSFFFKQKTAYEMRISDCSSAVCSSELNLAYVHGIDFAALNALNAVSADSLLAAPGALPTDHVHVHRDILGSLIEASNSYAEDLSSGLEDGTYEDTANLDDVEITIATARKILDSKSARLTQPSVKRSEERRVGKEGVRT